MAERNTGAPLPMCGVDSLGGRMKRLTVQTAAIGSAVVVAIGFIVGLTTASDAIPGTPSEAGAALAVKHEASPLKDARADCSQDTGFMGALTESHDGSVTLVLDGIGVDDTGGYDDPQAEIDAAFCILDAVGAPTDVAARMQDTRALDGMQDAEWGAYKVSWTYHPDVGMNLIITEN
jgi:hypothetical protein